MNFFRNHTCRFLRVTRMNIKRGERNFMRVSRARRANLRLSCIIGPAVSPIAISRHEGGNTRVMHTGTYDRQLTA